MSGHDWVFWYTGLWVWGALAAMLAVAVVVGLVACGVKAYHAERNYWWQWRVIGALKDMDLTSDGVVNAWLTTFTREELDPLLPRLRAVQDDLRRRALRTVTARAPHRVFACPECGMHHVDEGEWARKAHRKHLCANCEHEWKPYTYPTIGVRDECAPYGRDEDGKPLPARGPVSAATVAAEVVGDAAP